MKEKPKRKEKSLSINVAVLLLLTEYAITAIPQSYIDCGRKNSRSSIVPVNSVLFKMMGLSQVPKLQTFTAHFRSQTFHNYEIIFSRLPS